MESDAALVARVRLGDAAAFEVLMRRHFRLAYLVALARVNNTADAEDICQDAFVSAWQNIHSCRDPDRFASWLSRIVRNTAHNRGDYIRVRATEEIGQAARTPAPDASDRLVLQGELRVKLMAALSQLSPVQREVVLMHDLEGWTHAELARQLELSEVMSRRHLSDARKKLRGILGDYATLRPDHD
jgi:RNA polymerase sigma-70 factor (ECF subfamily)